VVNSGPQGKEGFDPLGEGRFELLGGGTEIAFRHRQCQISVDEDVQASSDEEEGRN
jgi:hypothetical protein